MVSEEWLRRYYDLALHVAQWSKDPSTKVGAVLVGRNRRSIALGYNGFPPGLLDTPDRLSDRAVKWKLTQHAERNVLDNASFDATDGVLVSTLFPCRECTKSIISKGIALVASVPPTDPRHDWLEDSTAWLREAGVKVHLFMPIQEVEPRLGDREWPERSFSIHNELEISKLR